MHDFFSNSTWRLFDTLRSELMFYSCRIDNKLLDNHFEASRVFYIVEWVIKLHDALDMLMSTGIV